MLFVIITAVLIAFSYEPPAQLGRLTSAVASVGGVLVFAATNWLLAALAARITLGRLRKSLDDREKALCRFQWFRWANTVVLLAAYIGVVHGLDWPGVVRVTWRLEHWVLVDDLLVLLPFLASVTLACLAYSRVDDFLRHRSDAAGSPTLPPMTRWGHVDFLFRYHLGFVLAPLLVLVALQDSVNLVLAGNRLRNVAEAASSVVGLGVILVFAPALLRVLWRAEPLPDGSLRTRLETLSRRLGFRASDILVWRTNEAVINAAVAGILPRPRYVLLSDGLLKHLTDDEIEAVFGHEIGHIRHHHLWFYVGFMVGTSLFLLVSMTLVSQLILSIMGQSAAHVVRSLAEGLVLPLAGMTIYFGVFFGFLSRRFERQADIFGCRAVSCGLATCPTEHVPPAASSSGVPIPCAAGIQTFVRALEKIAQLNGIAREMRSWRHFSIAKRVEFLEQLSTRPHLERRFQVIVLLLKSLVVIGLVASAWWVWTTAGTAMQNLLAQHAGSLS